MRTPEFALKLCSVAMKFHIMSDLHTEMWKGKKLLEVPETDADVIILAGDINTGVKSIDTIAELFPSNKPVLFVPGNHEYYGENIHELDEKLKERAREFPNIHVLNNDYVEIDGIVFVGSTLWTDFKLLGNRDMAIDVAKRRLMDFRVIKEQDGGTLRPKTVIELHQKSREFISQIASQNPDKKIVVITHHAPSIMSIHPIYFQNVDFEQKLLNAAFASNLENFIHSHPNIVLWVHGHTHEPSDYMRHRTRVINNPFGYPDEPKDGFIPDLVVEI